MQLDSQAVRSLALAGASLIITPTANFEPYSFVNRSIVRVRAFESHVSLVYANWAEDSQRVRALQRGAAHTACREQAGHTSEDGVRFNGQSVVASPQGELLLSPRRGIARGDPRLTETGRGQAS